jgi:hypothetical protein
MRDGAVAALILWRWERYAWLRHETHAHNNSSPDAPAEPPMSLTSIPPTHGQRNIQHFIQSYTPSAQLEELTDQDVADFKAECETTAQLPEAHIRSIMMYFRQRQRGRETAMAQRIYAGLKADKSRSLVPAQALRDRITYLQQAEAVGPRHRLNLQVAQELQRILAEETGYRSTSSRSVERGTQTQPMALGIRPSNSPPMNSGALPSTERVVPVVEVSALSDTTEGDVAMLVDEYGSESDETGAAPPYHDAFEEWHSFL